MKNVYIRNNNSIFKISIIYLLSLLPLIGYGFYKNGIHLYQKGYVSLFGMFKPLLFILTGLFLGALVNIIYEKFIKKNKGKLIDILFSSFHILYGTLIACLLSINTNYLLFVLVTFGILMLSKFLKIKSINIVAFISLTIILLTYLFSSFSYLNAYESNTILNLNAADYLIGRGSGGIATTFVAFLILSFIILWNLDTYKKEITLYSLVSFVVLITCYCIYKSNISNIFEILFTNGILFSLIYVAPEYLSSSYTKVGKIIYGISVGVLTFILYLINPAFAALGAILISSILSTVFDVKFE